MLPEDDRVIETCRSVLNVLMYILDFLNNIYIHICMCVCVCVCVHVMVCLIKQNYRMHGATIKIGIKYVLILLNSVELISRIRALN